MREIQSESATDIELSSGGQIAGCAGPAYRLWRSAQCSVPVLVSVPHSGRCYPEAVVSALRDSAQAMLRLEDRYIDVVARPVAAAAGASLMMADAPRAMIDLNRSADDIDWSMVRGEKPRAVRHSLANRRSRNGLGLVPRRIPGMGEIWRQPLEKAELDSWIEGIYRPYHMALASELERLRDRWGAVLLIDLHSMPPLRKTHPEDRPAEFVIGDRFGASCDPGLVDLAIRYLSAHGRRVAHNRPYSGGYVLDRYGQTARGIHAMQIEVCRTSYLDANLDQPSFRAGAITKLLTGLVETMAAEVEAISGNRQMPQAAE